MPGDRRGDALDARRLGVDGVVEGERAVEQAAGDLAALGHLAERGGLDGRGDLGGHRLDGRQDRHLRRAQADAGPEVDGVLDDVALGVEVGEDVDRRVGDEERLRVAGHVHDEDVADAPLGAQAGRRGGDLPHQFVGVQAALHQELALALADQRDGLRPRRRGCAARRRSARPARSMPCSAATAADLRLRARPAPARSVPPRRPRWRRAARSRRRDGRRSSPPACRRGRRRSGGRISTAGRGDRVGHRSCSSVPVRMPCGRASAARGDGHQLRTEAEERSHPLQPLRPARRPVSAAAPR